MWPCRRASASARAPSRSIGVRRRSGSIAYFTNPVRAIASWAWAAEIGRSAARGAGFLPARSRIHAAWRASTETIREASASASGVRLAAAPL